MDAMNANAQQRDVIRGQKRMDLNDQSRIYRGEFRARGCAGVKVRG